MREFGPLPADRALYVLRQVCHSLAEAHARGLVHRDVTPANVYLCRMGLDYDFVKVLDFGLVKFNDQRAIEHTLMGAAHTTAGTPAFMAPELIVEGEVDARADVYALGCVAYYLLTGQLVFEAETADEDVPAAPAGDALAAVAAHRAAGAAGGGRAGAGVPARRIRRDRPQNAEALLRLIDSTRPAAPLEQRAGARVVAAPSPGARRPARDRGTGRSRPGHASSCGVSGRVNALRAGGIGAAVLPDRRRPFQCVELP